MKVLIADDSDFIRVGLKKLIKSSLPVNQILTAESVSKAIEIINTNHPEFVIIDISFPESNGYEILKTVKNDSNNKLAIMLTNYPSDHARAKSLEEGADYFFDKSSEFDEVIAVIKKYIKENLQHYGNNINANKLGHINNLSGVL